MEKRFITACPACGNKIIETRGPLFRRVEEKPVVLIGIPHFPCGTCDTVSYRKELGVNNLLKETVEKDYNFVMAEEEDY